MLRVGRERRRVLRLREAKLSGDLPGLRLLDGADGPVRRRDREDAVEQLETLFVGGQLAELAGHQVVLRPPEQPGLVLGDLDHQHRLRLGQVAQLPHDLAHRLGLLTGDPRVGVRDPAQHVGEGGEEARAPGRQRLELGHDALHGVGVAAFGDRRPRGDRPQHVENTHAGPLWTRSSMAGTPPVRRTFMVQECRAAESPRRRLSWRRI